MNTQEIIVKLRNDLEENRFNHVLRVRDTAIELNERLNLNLDKEKVEYSALLHDCAKGLEDFYFNLFKEKYNLNEDEIFKVRVIAHAILGAIAVKEVFGIDDLEISETVRWHTTGCSDMTILEKLIFLADFIEPGREFDDAQKVRDEVNYGLDKAVLLSLNLQIEHLEKMAMKIDNHIYEARDFLEREMDE